MFLFMKESKCVTLSVDIKEIVKVLIHFGRGMPVLFLYTMPPAAARVRAALSMESKLGPYYDPTSTGIVDTAACPLAAATWLTGWHFCLLSRSTIKWATITSFPVQPFGTLQCVLLRAPLITP